ncbi:DNA translocase FtsK 4TM domain-containing protein, partial [Polymorphobacter multimanifer]
MASRATQQPMQARRPKGGARKPVAPSPVERLLAWGARALRTTGVWTVALLLIGVAVALVVAMAWYSPDDPSFNTVTGRAVANPMGQIGSHVADLLMQGVGWAGLGLALLPLMAGLRLLQETDFAARRALSAVPLGVVLLAAALGSAGVTAGLAPAGAGGALGMLAGWGSDALGDARWLEGVPVGLVVALLLAPLALGLLGWGTGVRSEDFAWAGALWRRDRSDFDDMDDEAEDAPLVLAPRGGEDVRVRADADGDAEFRGPRVVTASPSPPRPQRGRQPVLDLGDGGVLPGLDLLKPPPTGPARRID